MDEMLDIVKSSLSHKPDRLHAHGSSQTTRPLPQSVPSLESRPGWDGGGIVAEDEFDDYGTGTGIEGDLEMGDEE